MRNLRKKILSSRRRAQALFAVLFVAVVATGFVLDLRVRYRDAIERAEEAAHSLSEVIAEHTARTFEGGGSGDA